MSQGACNSQPQPHPDLQRLVDVIDLPMYETDVLNIIQQNPSAARVKYRLYHELHYPIYVFMRRSASFRLINILYRAFPQAVKEMHTKKRTLLHCACINRVSLDIVSLLINEWPEAAVIKDEDGRVPLHYACSHGTARDTIFLLLEKCPSSIRVKDNHGRLPLHLACMVRPSSKAVSILLEKYPAAVGVKDTNNQTPVDIWAQKELSSYVSVVPRIMLHGVSSLFQKENTGRATAMEVMSDWWDGVVLVFDLLPPSITVQCLEDIALNVLPSLLSVLARRGKKLLLWKIIRNRQDILKIC